MLPWVCRCHRILCLHRHFLGEVDPGVSRVSVQRPRPRQRAGRGSEGHEDVKMAQGHQSQGYPALEETPYAEREFGGWHVGSDVGWRSEYQRGLVRLLAIVEPRLVRGQPGHPNNTRISTGGIA